MERGTTRPLGANGLRLTALGLGSASLGNLHGPVDESQAQAALDAAWSSGIRYFDTAPLYGRGLGELRVGQALRQRKRDDFILSTKVGWRVRARDRRQASAPEGALPHEIEADYSRDDTLRSVEDSLIRTGLNRLDFVLIHDIDAYNHGAEGQRLRFREAMQGALPALAQLRDEGLVRAIGIGVSEWRVCDSVLDHASVDGFILARGYTLLNHSPALSFLRRCSACGAGVVAAAPFHTGLLARGSAEAGTARYDHHAAPPEVLERVCRLEAVCAIHGVSLPAAALQFPLRHPAVTSVLPGPRSPEQVRRTIAAFEETIPRAFWSDLILEHLIDPAAVALLDGAGAAARIP